MAEKPKELEERTAVFAEDVGNLCVPCRRTISNYEDVKQLMRASGSVAANCIEGNEALGRKDRVMKFRTCRKEAKEYQLWLRLLDTGSDATLKERCVALRQEAPELKLIFLSIVKKLE